MIAFCHIQIYNVNILLLTQNQGVTVSCSDPEMGGGGQLVLIPTPPPLKNHKNIVFLSITVPDPLKNRASIQFWPMIILPAKSKKNHILSELSWTPSDKTFCICACPFKIYMGAQWLSGRVLDLRPKGRGFKPHRRHCVVVLEQDTFILA